MPWYLGSVGSLVIWVGFLLILFFLWEHPPILRGIGTVFLVGLLGFMAVAKRHASTVIASLQGQADNLRKTHTYQISLLEQKIKVQNAIFNQISEGFVTTDLSETVIMMNPASFDILEIPHQEFSGKHIEEVIRIPDIQDSIRQTLRDRTQIDHEFTLYPFKKHILTKSLALLDESKTPIGAALTLKDLTKERQLESYRRDFVSNVTHELKTPLTAIKGFAETLFHNPQQPEVERLSQLQVILKQVNRLEDLIQDVLLLSKLEAEDTELEVFTLNIRPVIENAIQMVELQAREKHMSVTYKNPKDLTAQINPSLLELAIINLLDNAIKYSDAGKSVEVETFEKNGLMDIVVTDHGKGISSDHLPRIFERFYRVEKSRSRKMGDTGLGLAIVKHIAQLHQGDISVESQVGKGSQFILSLKTSKS
jgi:two-component system phosphate regulon sensor histidine kinase PhoR